MSDFKSKLENFFERIEGAFDERSLRRRQKRNFDNPLKIVPFFGYGTNKKIRIKGRVLEDEGAIVSHEDDSVWRNIFNMYRRFETDEIPFAKVKAIFQNSEIETTADDEGYFTAEFSNVEMLSEKLWQEVGFELLEPISIDNQQPQTTGSFLTSVSSAKFGIISDIDDTVISTNVLNRLKMLITTIASNEHTRVPFEGVSAFYKALQKGSSGNENNPIFYVSSSPWNLYGFLIEIMRKHEIPFGPLFLKDFGSHTIFSGGDHLGHKLENITQILETFSHLPFILIGDSGEKDPEIYRQIIEQFPNRIRAVYIRDVNPNPVRRESITKLITEINEKGRELVLAPDSEFAARHAAENKLISTDALASVIKKKVSDENAPTISETIVDEIS